MQSHWTQIQKEYKIQIKMIKIHHYNIINWAVYNSKWSDSHNLCQYVKQVMRLSGHPSRSIRNTFNRSWFHSNDTHYHKSRHALNAPDVTVAIIREVGLTKMQTKKHHLRYCLHNNKENTVICSYHQ